MKDILVFHKKNTGKDKAISLNKLIFNIIEDDDSTVDPLNAYRELWLEFFNYLFWNEYNDVLEEVASCYLIGADAHETVKNRLKERLEELKKK